MRKAPAVAVLSAFVAYCAWMGWAVCAASLMGAATRCSDVRGGEASIQAGVTIAPSPTFAVAIPLSCSFYETQLEGPYQGGAVIVDGPWTSLPAGAGPGLALDEEEGALTLQTSMTNVAFALRPDPDKSAFPNSVWELKAYQGRLYLSYGDFFNNQGPVDIVHYDPQLGALVREMLDAPEEQWASWLVAADGWLYVAGGDARESETFGNIYLNDGLGWQKRRTIYKGLHVRSVADFQGRLYASYATGGSPPVTYTFALASDNRGASWTYEVLDRSAVRDANAEAFAIAHHVSGTFLYAIVYRLPAVTGRGERGIYRYDSDRWERVDLPEAENTFTPYDLFPFGGWMLVRGRASGSMKVYALDGRTQSEVTFLRDKNVSWARCAVHDGWLYYLDGLPYDAPPGPTNLYRTRDLQSWETLGAVSLLPGARPASLAFAHGRLYVGATNSGGSEEGPGLYAATNAVGEAEYLSPVFGLQEPLAGGSLHFERVTPPGTSVRFQVRSARSEGELAQAPFVGPNGAEDSFYRVNGQRLWAGHDGHTYVQYRAVLASSNPILAPFLRRVTLVARSDRLSYLSIELGTLDWRAGEPIPITVTAHYADGSPIPISGTVALSARDLSRYDFAPITPREMTLSGGTGTASVTLQRAVPSRFCVQVAGRMRCSPVVSVRPGPAESISVTTDLPEPRPHWSPVGHMGQPFTLSLTILDRYRNVVTDYTGTVQCQCRQWVPVSAELPSYTFQLADRGYRQFPAGAVIPGAGEWNVVCFDTSDPRIAGTQTVNIQP